VCIVPYGEVAAVDDGAGRYLERFLPGAFREQVEEARTAPLRVWLNLAHRRKAVIGHATGLTERDGGLYGTFAVHRGVTGDKVLAAICDGVLAGVSMQATPLRSREVDGVTLRQEGHLCGVALVPNPAYRHAKVLSIRRAVRGEQAGPASPLEATLWDLERLDRKLRALACSYLDDALEMRAERRRSTGAGRSYASDRRYQRVLQLRQQIAQQRAELEAAIEPSATPDQMLQPKVLRRVVSSSIAIR
jgi:HK97 family phage prohead protease